MPSTTDSGIECVFNFNQLIGLVGLQYHSRKASDGHPKRFHWVEFDEAIVTYPEDKFPRITSVPLEGQGVKILTTPSAVRKYHCDTAGQRQYVIDLPNCNLDHDGLGDSLVTWLRHRLRSDVYRGRGAVRADTHYQQPKATHFLVVDEDKVGAMYCALEFLEGYARAAIRE